jgi:hypothetical protein
MSGEPLLLDTNATSFSTVLFEKAPPVDVTVDAQLMRRKAPARLFWFSLLPTVTKANTIYYPDKT